MVSMSLSDRSLIETTWRVAGSALEAIFDAIGPRCLLLQDRRGKRLPLRPVPRSREQTTVTRLFIKVASYRQGWGAGQERVERAPHGIVVSGRGVIGRSA